MSRPHCEVPPSSHTISEYLSFRTMLLADAPRPYLNKQSALKLCRRWHKHCRCLQTKWLLSRILITILQVIEHDDELGGLDDDQLEVSVNGDILGSDALASELDSGLDFRDHTETSHGISIRSTQAAQAVLEAAMSSAVHHPNVVQTFHYQTLEANERRAVRVTNL